MLRKVFQISRQPASWRGDKPARRPQRIAVPTAWWSWGRAALAPGGVLAPMRTAAHGMQGLGQLISWTILLGVPLAAVSALVQPLLGTRDFDLMWDTLWTILMLVFVHGALRIHKDMELSGGSMRPPLFRFHTATCMTPLAYL